MGDARKPRPARAALGGRRGGLTLCLLVLLLAGGCSSRLGAPDPGTQEGRDVLDLWRLIFWLAMAIGALVLVLIAWCVVRYRRRAGDEELPPQVPGNLKLEIFYTAVPLVIVAALFAVTIRVDNRTLHAGSRPTLRIAVTGYQWSWRFDYPAQRVAVVGTVFDPPTMVLPVGGVVHLDVRTADVIHSFFVPGFLVKRDLIPGVHNILELKPVRTATYAGHCAEFCGLDHARMNFRVRVVSASDFDAWAASRRRATS